LNSPVPDALLPAPRQREHCPETSKHEVHCQRDDPSQGDLGTGGERSANAGEMILAAINAVKFGLTVTDLADTWAPYLTMAEGLKLGPQSFATDVERLSCCAT